MILYEHDNLMVRELKESDAAWLLKWLSDPVVIEFYEGRDRPHDMEMVQTHFYQRTFEITRCMVLYQGKEIGYIQFYPISEEEMVTYGFLDFSGKIYGLDQFIGEPDHWNRGIGTELVKSMIPYLIHVHQAAKIVLDPQTWNVRAIRVYEKCGFRKVLLLPEHEWHEGAYRDSWLMEYNP
jgi:aminoglycoside 6'-N-acetyltransferase